MSFLESSPPRRNRTLFAVLLLFIPWMPGCSGCQKDPELSDEDEAEVLSDPLTFEQPTVQPGGTPESFRGVKAGHWVSVTQQVTSNSETFEADVETQAMTGQLRPISTELTNYDLIGSRVASLTKGQPKEIEAVFYVPNSISRRTLENAPSFDPRSNVFLNFSVRSRTPGFRFSKDEPVGVRMMHETEFYLSVLADDPDQYLFFQDLNSIHPPDGSDFDRLRRFRLYRLSFPTANGPVSLPSQAMFWTSTAYLIWDGFDPESLTLDQRQALVDWLHWGGQLIVSGPKSLPLLRGSFLDDYLPADAEGSLNLFGENFETLNSNWSLSDEKSKTRQSINLGPGESLIGTTLNKREPGLFVPGTGELVCEGLVGRGRIVVTAFNLTDRALQTWACYDSFVNGCLLRHPARKFKRSSSNFGIDVEWATVSRPLKDPLFASSLRYVSRDTETLTNDRIVQHAKRFEPSGQWNAELEPEAADSNVATSATSGDSPNSPWTDYGWIATPGSGVAGWNDLSGISNAARQILKDSSGISPPSASLVGKVLLGYLILLVPVNWLFFRLIGRVEWAWIAAPMIAVAGAMVVVKVARLDIGFARSRTEIGVLELQTDYPRGYLTRYIAIYSSLATPYDLAFDGQAVVAQPFYQVKTDETSKEIVLERRQDTTLKDLLVDSNTTRFVHSEQMIDVEGPIHLAGTDVDGFELVNDSNLSLIDVGIVRRNQRGRIETAWLGMVGERSRRRVNFRNAGNQPRLPEWNDSQTTLSLEAQSRQMLKRLDRDHDQHLSRVELATEPAVLANLARADVQNTLPTRANAQASNQLETDQHLNLRELRDACRMARTDFISLGGIVDLTSQGLELKPGDTRLIGWTGQDLRGMSVKPTASQTDRKTLVLAHLSYRQPPPAQPDENLPSDVLDVALEADLN